MSLVKANTYQDASGGSNAVFSGVASPPNSMGFRNRILNGGMVIDQRNAGASVTPSGSGEAYVVDRWLYETSQGSKFSVQRNAGSVTPPTGFTNYLGVTSLSAYTPISSDYMWIGQRIEGFNTADLAWGTASAQTVTLSFWVRSSLTGSFGASLSLGGSRTYPFNYTISAANTWEYKTVTISGDTSGTWPTDNTSSIRVGFNIGTGSNRIGTTSSWSASDFRGGLTGATSVVGTNGATWYITGVQLEAGTVASPFERRDYGRELMMCQRYFLKVASGLGVSGIGEVIGQGFYFNSTQLTSSVFFPVTMRTAPTIYQTTGTNYYRCERNGGSDDVNSFTIYYQTPQAAMIYNNTEASGTAGQSGIVFAANSLAFFGFQAEL